MAAKVLGCFRRVNEFPPIWIWPWFLYGGREFRQAISLTKPRRTLKQNSAPWPLRQRLSARPTARSEGGHEPAREKLGFAIWQTFARVAFRRVRYRDDRYRITLSDGVIELYGDIKSLYIISPTNDEISSPGRWRGTLAFLRERLDVSDDHS